MRLLFLCILAIALVWGVQRFGAFTGERASHDHPSGRVELSWSEQKREIEDRYGIRIEIDQLELPDGWRSLSPRWSAVPIEERGRALEGLAIDLSRYDPAFLRLHLARVFLFDSLSFDGRSFGGTNDHRSRWLYLQHRWLGDTGHDYAMGFHHELSSILLKRHPDRFPEREWRAGNRADFHYAFSTSTGENLASGRTGLTVDAALGRAGFVSEYGQLTLEDDVNTYAQYWIAKPSKLDALGRRHPPVARKARILARFLDDIGFVRRDGS